MGRGESQKGTLRNAAGGMPVVPAVVGPTAAGKTAAVILLAQEKGMEVVSADSRQIYRRMDIGTAKPSSLEASRVPHHLIDVIEPWEAYSCGRYRKEALSAVEAIFKRGKTPLLVGGSGLYLKALEKGLFEGPERNDALRSELHATAERLGREHLHQRLAMVDPEAASSIHPRNIERVIRALEVYESTGIPISVLRKKSHLKSPFKLVTVGLRRSRQSLHRLIDERFTAMLDRGFLDEVRRLIAEGFSEGWPSFRTVGYREMARHLRGELPYEAACEQARRATRQFAKRQLTWFARAPVEVWLDIEDGESPAETSRRILTALVRAGAV